MRQSTAQYIVTNILFHWVVAATLCKTNVVSILLMRKLRLEQLSFRRVIIYLDGTPVKWHQYSGQNDFSIFVFNLLHENLKQYYRKSWAIGVIPGTQVNFESFWVAFLIWTMGIIPCISTGLWGLSETM